MKLQQKGPWKMIRVQIITPRPLRLLLLIICAIALTDRCAFADDKNQLEHLHAAVANAQQKAGLSVSLPLVYIYDRSNEEKIDVASAQRVIHDSAARSSYKSGSAGKVLQELHAKHFSSRFHLWAAAMNALNASTVAEIGVWQGEMTHHILTHVPKIDKYVLLDPWRHLDHWNKPFNVENEKFKAVFDQAMKRTEAMKGKTLVLRGTTAEMIDGIPDQSLDFVYVDGDHTLEGAYIDFYLIFDKIKPGGVMAGDDFTDSQQHGKDFAPTKVKTALYAFLQEKGMPITNQQNGVYVYDNRQFAVVKPIS